MKCRAFSILITLAFAGAAACAAAPTPAIDPELADVAARLARCRAEGRDAGTFAAYATCKQDQGIGDLGGGGRP